MAAPTPTQARLRGSYVVIGSTILPAWIAQDEGIFDRYGLDVQLTYIAGAAKNAEALLAGDVDFAVTPGSSAIGPGLEGADLVMVASWSSKLAFSLMVQPGIDSVEDLRGKRVGVVRRGSNSEIWAVAVLRAYGLEPDRDYAVLSVGGQAEIVAALQNGAIDAAVLTPPINLRGRQLGFRELLGYRDHGIEFANVGIVTSRRFVREQADVLDRLLRACAEGVAVMFQQPEVAMRAIQRYTEVDERDLQEETLAFEQSRTIRDMIPTPAAMRGALDELATSNPKAASANPMDFADTKLVQRLSDSGFIAGLYR
jgi:ABC-type nitrate/sulfonate/bicarbonate transport system substrate-binding protein